MRKLKSTRIASIDILRGLVMVLMALDHVRDYFHINAFTGNYPENMESTTLILFFTRFITHFCAPVFVFLAGTSAFLYGQKKPKGALSKFLITRGLWLILIEIFVNNFLWWFDVTYGFTNLQVIWAIGLSMIILGLVIYLPKRVILILGLLIVFGHNLLDTITFEGKSFGEIIWYILHQLHYMELWDGIFVSFSYPVLPWFGIMLLGYCFGELYKHDFDAYSRKKWLFGMGVGSIVLFFILRGVNIYGDLNPWEFQSTQAKTIISFFNATKYPPSLAYILMTLGPSFLFLRGIESIKNWFSEFLIVFGRVPFFYYIIHILVIHGFALLGLLITGKDWKLMILDNETMSSGALQGYGYPLWLVYLIWVGIVLFLYPICNKYMIYKLNNKGKWWLSYL
nr:heparan-alpha-glucosaminide N-acetyltransferase domain-containing protein [uncultured Allomuricauda sp.]